MALQQQRERTLTEPKTQSGLAAFWREVVVENPVYRREVSAVAIPASYSPEKAEALREKSRKTRQEWETLALWQKCWRTLRPCSIVFAIASVLVSVFLTYLPNAGIIGFINMFIGPLIGGMFGASVVSAATIAGEREKRTWNALLLTQLTPQQIIGGKVANILRTLLIGSGSLVAVFLALVVQDVLPPTVLLLVALILLPHLLLTTLVGVRSSLWSKSTQEAQKRTMWQSLGLGLLALAVSVTALLALFGKAPVGLLLLVPAYCLIALLASRRVWGKLLGDLWLAPKDFSG